MSGENQENYSQRREKLNFIVFGLHLSDTAGTLWDAPCRAVAYFCSLAMLSRTLLFVYASVFVVPNVRCDSKMDERTTPIRLQQF